MHSLWETNNDLFNADGEWEGAIDMWISLAAITLLILMVVTLRAVVKIVVKIIRRII